MVSGVAVMLIVCVGPDGPVSTGDSALFIVHAVSAIVASAAASVLRAFIGRLIPKVAEIDQDFAEYADFVAVLVAAVEGDLRDRRDDGAVAAQEDQRSFVLRLVANQLEPEGGRRIGDRLPQCAIPLVGDVDALGVPAVGPHVLHVVALERDLI